MNGRHAGALAAAVSLTVVLAGCAASPPSSGRPEPTTGTSTPAAPATPAVSSPPATAPQSPEEVDPSTELSAATLTQVRDLRVFFGHQSVGYNVMKGINLLAQEFGVEIPNYANLKEGQSPRAGAGFLAHAKVGENGYPLRKLDEFDSIIRAGVGDGLDVALVKLCYIDFGPKTDVAAVFKAYRTRMGQLVKDYPEVAFVYATVPLEVDADQANRVRTEFNELVRAEYGPTGRLWDIAAAESTDPDGNRVGGKNFEALYAGYASDGAHLNPTGAVVVAEPLVLLLASLAA